MPAQADCERAGLIVMFSLAVVVSWGCEESVTEKETEDVPTEVCAGVPVMEPVVPPMDSPEGNPEALNV
jgi:hypothetical protein